jgi:hypothetical protein
MREALGREAPLFALTVRARTATFGRSRSACRATRQAALPVRAMAIAAFRVGLALRDEGAAARAILTRAARTAVGGARARCAPRCDAQMVRRAFETRAARIRGARLADGAAARAVRAWATAAIAVVRAREPPTRAALSGAAILGGAVESLSTRAAERQGAIAIRRDVEAAPEPGATGIEIAPAEVPVSRTTTAKAVLANAAAAVFRSRALERAAIAAASAVEARSRAARPADVARLAVFAACRAQAVRASVAAAFAERRAVGAAALASGLTADSAQRDPGSTGAAVGPEAPEAPEARVAARIEVVSERYGVPLVFTRSAKRVEPTARSAAARDEEQTRVHADPCVATSHCPVELITSSPARPM